MPVKGLTDVLRLPRRGKIHLGEKKISEKTGKEYPIALDYFVVPEEVKAVYGEKPKKIDIMFPLEDRNVFFPVFYKRYSETRGLICRGDGQLAMELDEETGEMKEIACMGKLCPYFKEEKCTIVGNLQVVLPKISGLGIYQIDTGSINSVININSSIEMIRGMLGRVSWIPLILEVNMEKRYPFVKGRRMKVKVPIMNITADVSVNELIKKRLVQYDKKQIIIENPEINEKPELLPPLQKKPDKKSTEKKISKSIILSRYRLNARYHVLRKKLLEVGFWDDREYEMWLDDEFRRVSASELTNEEMSRAIALMSGYFNRYKEEEKELEKLEKEKEKENIPEKVEGFSKEKIEAEFKKLKRECFKINYFADDESYHEWIKETFNKDFDLELSLEEKLQAIELLKEYIKR